MKIFKVDFDPVWPVPSCLIIAAKNLKQAKEMAANTVTHAPVKNVEEVDISKPTVIEYLSGDY